MKTWMGGLTVAGLAFGMVACSSSGDGDGGGGAAGSTTASGGSTSTGGASATGGASGSGGSAGSTSSGGTAGAGTGGASAGGSSGTGGGAGAASGGTAGAGGGAAGTAGSAGMSSGGRGGTAAGGAAGKAGAGGAAPCANDCTSRGLECCDGECVNTGNDVLNCGRCNNECQGRFPFCDGGTCGTPPCTGTGCPMGEQCCGNDCCTAGELCCDVPGGPVGGAPRCVMAMDGTCPTGCPNCPCASPDTPIATPSGDRAIETLMPGDWVYSVHEGAITPVPVRAVNRNPVVDHYVLEVELASGVKLAISGLHPTADGRTFSALRPGDELDGVRVTRVTQVPYPHDYTFDILPDSSSGAYFAGGVLIGSTLQR